MMVHMKRKATSALVEGACKPVNVKQQNAVMNMDNASMMMAHTIMVHTSW